MMTRRLVSFFVLTFGLLLAAAASSARAEEPRLAIGGYDPVAYFTDAKPTPGRSDTEYLWHGARWRFASPEHRALFVADPERYAPQYDGYCAMGAAWEKDAHKDVPDPNSWAIVDGKLYLTHSAKAFARWRENIAENISRADRNWAELKNSSAVYDGFPNRKSGE
jgi:hypothetical protein